MAGALALEKIDAGAITINSSAYNACRKILRMQVAAVLARNIPGTDWPLSRSWTSTVDAWYVDLAKGGASFLGDGATASGTSDPDGPTWHGSELTRDTTAEMSSTVPMLRKDDRL